MLIYFDVYMYIYMYVCVYIMVHMIICEEYTVYVYVYKVNISPSRWLKTCILMYAYSKYIYVCVYVWIDVNIPTYCKN